jgi:hypothetical protein
MNQIAKEQMAIMRADKIASIGAGYWGKNLIRNFNDLGVLAWICELDADWRAHLATTYPMARFTDEVDQVLVDHLLLEVGAVGAVPFLIRLAKPLQFCDHGIYCSPGISQPT